MAASTSPVACGGRVTSAGAVRPGRLGEVMVAIRGGVKAFLAQDVDGGSIERAAGQQQRSCERQHLGVGHGG